MASTNDFDATFIALPADGDDVSEGAARIRDTRNETIYRMMPSIDAGTLVSGYFGEGRPSPGSAKAFTGTDLPDNLVKPDGTDLATGEMPNESASAVIGGGSATDRGLLWVDESGAVPVLRYWDTVPTTPRFNAIHPHTQALINGSMQIWQRNTTFTVTAAGNDQYTADRFYVNTTGADVTVSRAAAFTNASTSFCMNLAGIASWSAGYVGTRIEGADLLRLTTGSANTNQAGQADVKSLVTFSCFINNSFWPSNFAISLVAPVISCFKASSSFSVML